MSHETHWDAATRELIARAEARGAERVAQAVERLAEDYEALADYTDDPRSTPDQRARAHAGVIAAEHLRALLAEHRPEATR